MKAVNHAATSKTENFVQMKNVAHAVKIIKNAVVVKIIQLLQTDVTVDTIAAIHALQYQLHAILVNHASGSNLAVIATLAVIANLAVIATLAEIFHVIAILVVDLVDAEMVPVDHKDILNRLVTNLVVSFEIELL